MEPQINGKCKMELFYISGELKCFHGLKTSQRKVEMYQRKVPNPHNYCRFSKGFHFITVDL